ncbi:MAG: efflux RND transporter periplasmic adaptor subunit [Bacillota bacterium]
MRRKIFLVLTVTAILLGTLSGCAGKDPSKADGSTVEQEKYTPVEVETVKAQTISNETTFSGKVQPNQEIMIVPKVPGKVAQVNVKVGTPVKKGMALFTVDQEDALKQVDQTKLSMEAASVNYEKTKEQIDNAKANLERTKQLYEQGAVPLNQYEQAQLSASDKPLEAVKVQYEQAQLAYRQAVDSLNNTAVTSPIDGVVSVVNVEVGEMASTAQSAVVVVDLSKLYVKIDVPENLISALAMGQEVKIEIPSASEESFTGKIDTISPASDDKTQLYPIQIHIENKDQLLKSGMFAKVHLKTDTKENVLAVKSEAVLDTDNKSYVYVVEGDRAIEKEVKIGLDTGSYVEIVSGLKEGEQVLVKGQHYVENDSKVKVVRGGK